MKEKIFNKKVLIIVGIVILILILGIVFKNQIRNGIYNIKTSGINKDIIIEVLWAKSNSLDSIQPLETGHSSTTMEYYIDLSKKTIYYVEDYNVYQPGEKDYGHHYTLKNSKKLTNEEIEEFKSIENMESDSTIFSVGGTYYRVTYNNKTIDTTFSNSTIKDIINSLK